MQKTYDNIPNKIIIHHTWLPEDNYITEEFDNIKNYHESIGWGDIGYHWVIERVDNKLHLFEGRPEVSQGAHTVEEKSNFTSISIAMIADYDQYPPDEETLVFLTDVIEWINTRWETDFPLYGHRDFAPYKSCPGTQFDMEDLKQRVATRMANPKIKAAFDEVNDFIGKITFKND